MAWTKAKQKAYMKMYRKAHPLTPWGKVYHSIYQRCHFKNHARHKYYGGRGIKLLMTPSIIKELWFRDQACNLIRPSIDRVDHNGNYTKDNCRFIELTDNLRQAALLRWSKRS
jgi:hypothetical protein